MADEATKISKKPAEKRKQKAPIPPKRNEEMVKAVENRVQVEKRTREVILMLIEEAVSPEVLQSAARFINVENYHDIVAERSLAEICGYPLCPNALPGVTSQKYRIDAKSNKVYDITDRKNYCSGKCYAASTMYEKQLSEIPVWLRERDYETPKVVVPGEMRGVPGVAVKLTDDDLDSLADEVRRMQMEEAKEGKDGPLAGDLGVE